MTPGAPAGAALQQKGVVGIPDIDLARLILDLGVALETKVRVTLDEHLAVNRAVRVVANGTAFAKGLVLEDERTGLLAMTLRAILVQPRHGQAARGFKDVAAMRVVTLHAIHTAFDYRMTLRQMKFRLGLKMALETGRRVLARVDDELAPPPARFDVLAGWTMTGFASRLAGHLRVRNMDARMRAGGEHTRDVRVAIKARAVAHISRARNLRRRHHGPLEARTGNKQEGYPRTDKTGGSHSLTPARTLPPF